MAFVAQKRLENHLPAPETSSGRWDILLAGAILFLLVLGFVLTPRLIALTVDGVELTLRTHRRNGESMLRDLGMGDSALVRLESTSAEPSNGKFDFLIQRARRVQILADGRRFEQITWADRAAEIIADAGLSLHPADIVLLNGLPIEHTQEVRNDVGDVRGNATFAGRLWNDEPDLQATLTIERAVPMVVEDNGLPFELRTTARTVGRALREAGITLYLGDRVRPQVGAAITSGLRVQIERSVPISLDVDGRRLRTRTQGESVADLLSELGIGLSGLDEVSPGLETPLFPDIAIQVLHVEEDIEVDEEIASFETVFEPDPNLLIDTQQVVSGGAEGITRTRTRVRYENEEERFRILEDTWIAQLPATRVIAYGQKVVPSTLTLEDGTELTYWRKIRMRASSYSANTAGVSPTEPWYGKTYSGDDMRFGVVAVDPLVIPLRTNVYVPGYGYGDALDTGSAIRARRIDLGYDDDNLVLWAKWVDVYLLWPPPPDYQISWVLPNWPLE